jgi:hypothetical protein
MDSVQDNRIAEVALHIIKAVLAIHSDPAQKTETNKNIQHELYHMGQLVKPPFLPVVPNTIAGLGRPLGFFAHMAAGRELPRKSGLGFTGGPNPESGIVLALAKSLREGQVDAEKTLHEIGKELCLPRTIFPEISQWDSLHTGVPVEQNVREILNGYYRGYIGREEQVGIVSTEEEKSVGSEEETNVSKEKRTDVHTQTQSWNATARMIHWTWENMDLANKEYPTVFPTLHPTYGVPCDLPERLMEAFLKLAQVYHNYQLYILQQAFEVLDFLELPHPLLEAEPVTPESECIHTPEGKLFNLSCPI